MCVSNFIKRIRPLDWYGNCVHSLHEESRGLSFSVLELKLRCKSCKR